MPRPVLAESQLHPAIRSKVATLHQALLDEVQQAIAVNPVVVVGMHQNPFVRRARRTLDQAGIAHQDMIYGSYLSQWRRRSALKMWTGWPTFPMVFVKGTLIGGAQELEALLASGEFKALLNR